MLSLVLLQAAAAGLAKLGAAVGAGLATIGAGIGIGIQRRRLQNDLTFPKTRLVPCCTEPVESWKSI